MKSQKNEASGRICRTCKKIKQLADLCGKCGNVVCVDCSVGSHQFPECPKHQFKCKSCSIPYQERCEGGCKDCDRDICTKCSIVEKERKVASLNKEDCQRLIDLIDHLYVGKEIEGDFLIQREKLEAMLNAS